jgi:hypothetical protein
MRGPYIRSLSEMRGRRHPVPCWSYPEMTPRTLLVLPEDGERALGFALTLYPAGPAEASILRPKGRFPTGGYLRPKGHFPPGGYLRPKGRFPSHAQGAAGTRKKGPDPTKNPE